jgi:hypothetical protein
MRRRIEALADQLEEFVSEDGHDALVVNGDGSAAGLLGSAVDLNEQRGSIDVSLPFFDAFESAETLASALDARIVAIAAAAKIDLPALTATASIERAVERLTTFAASVRAFGDVRVAVWICPSAIVDEAAYLAAVLRLVGASRSCDPPLRIAARETCVHERPLRALLRARAIPTLEVAIDLSNAAIRDALAEDAMDPKADVAARAAAALSVAMSDAAAGKTADALSALAMLAQFHEARGEAGASALCVVLSASVHAIAGEVDVARASVERGLALAIEAKAIPVVLVGAVIAGQLAMRAGDPVDANQRFDVAARLAARLGAAEMLADALLQRSQALVAIRDGAAARDALLCAAQAARHADSEPLMASVLAALAARYRTMHQFAEAEAIEVLLAGRPPAPVCGAHEHAP